VSQQSTLSEGRDTTHETPLPLAPAARFPRFVRAGADGSAAVDLGSHLAWSQMALDADGHPQIAVSHQLLNSNRVSAGHEESALSP
jgi:hypothetical protein